MKILISILVILTLLSTVTAVPVDVKDTKNSKYTPEEQMALKKFRDLMGPLPQPYMNSDGFLINWIRGSDSGGTSGYNIIRNSTYYKYSFAPGTGFDLDNAAKKLEKTLAWRKENNIDGILKEDFSDLMKRFPFDITRKDKDGRPVFLVEFSNWDVKTAAEAPPAESGRFVRYLDYMLESVAAKAREQGTTDYTYFIDAAGFNMDTHACPKCLGFFTYFPQHFETHYPQQTKNLISVNAPKAYDSFDKIVSSNLSPAAQKGHKTFDNNKERWLKEVGQIIAVDQIPQHFIEGTTTTKKPSNLYPWAALQTCAGCKVSN